MTAAGGLPACSSSGEGDEASAEPTPWQRELANLAPDGSRSLDSALRLFAMAFGPVPGVPSQPRPQEFIDATTAVREIQARDAELTPEQRDAVETALRLPADARTVEISPEGQVSSSTAAEAGGGSRARRAAAFVAPPSGAAIESFSKMALLARNRVAASLGWNFRGPIILSIGETRSGGALAFTSSRFDSQGYAACDIRYDPNIVSAAQAANTMIHEVVHCFQNSVFPDQASATTAYVSSKWAWEGSSEWIAATMVGPFADTPFWWDRYLQSPGTSLFSRIDDAIAFYAHLQESGINPFSVMATIWRATGSGSVAAFSASGAATDGFLDSWASSYFRDQQLGRAWDTTGPGISNTRGPWKPVKVANGATRSLAVDAYRNGIYVLKSTADVLRIEVGGRGRLANGKIDRVLLGDAEFCTREDGECKCPEGEGQGPPRLAGNPSLALTGGVSGATATLTGEEFDETKCKKKARASKQPRGRNLGVVVTRPAYDAGFYIQELDVIDLAACGGVRGQWKGVLRAGGFGVEGADALVEEVPVSFTVDARGRGRIQARVTSTVVTPVNQGQAGTDVDIAVQVSRDGKRISFNGNFFQDLGLTDRPITRSAGNWCR
jgi:hypothetical protein